MALAPRLDLRQKQSLVMTPQMQQAVKLLTLSNIEMQEFLREEIEKNPLLEQENEDASQQSESRDEISADGPSADTIDNDAGFGEENIATADTLIAEGAGERDQPLDSSAEDVFHHDCPSDSMGADSAELGGTTSSGSMGSDDSLPDLEARHSEAVSLADHLRQQAGMMLSDAHLFVAEMLINNIDENGYLQGSLHDIADQLGTDIINVENVLSVIHSMDPSGVGARDLAECLTIQAKEADRYDPAMARMLKNLDLVARRDIARLKRICRVDEDDIIDMIEEIRGYQPRPGSIFADDVAAPIVPDVLVSESMNGWKVQVNPATLPRVLINRSYHSELVDGVQDKISRNWLNECMADAQWLVRTLDQRQRTITKVATELVRRQEEFFRHGVAHLKPLTLREIAEKVEMHESTISRVTSNKYLICERGVFELKYFFSSGISSADGGDAVSSEAVKDALKTLIDNEDPKKILSDDKLVTLLKDQGYELARRTVAKYREAMNLGSSVQRRRLKSGRN